MIVNDKRKKVILIIMAGTRFNIKNYDLTSNVLEFALGLSTEIERYLISQRTKYPKY